MRKHTQKTNKIINNKNKLELDIQWDNHIDSLGPRDVAVMMNV